ncbi:hypothetical protein I3843_14G019900 [Carya illinoinensis]|uniref:Nucleotide-diphospho-sugar transferase domain-containing protein n=1 Tax=Carya illinoinensis TaxID=32201 RepID=A0A8T1NA04_CARIL|nr:uncharacterized protein At1g28695-like [Carya illinoinensis]KAG6628509.1 hypothetical protein CIPAW_14G018100 [Carya illinoinensis]KAG6677323.1 hypothetical protein I3842_14G020600 [Carya illinoinensis]KAG7946069.1 hypothetical protein I3843_14G019900 [Carya illinoinensis]
MDYAKHSVGNPALLLMFFIGVFYLFLWSSSITNDSSNTTTDIHAPRDQDDLEEALSKASMANKTVIITIVNKAYAEQDVGADTTMLDLFLESFWLGEDTRSLLNHLLLVAVDQTAYDRCVFRRLNCYRLETDGVDFGGEKIYMSEDFIKMMWRRTHFLLEVLKRGYSFIFTDTDVMWLRNPFLRLSKNESEDLQISTDVFLGDPLPEKQLINTGFYYVRSRNKTIAMFDKWYTMKENSTGQKEQDVLLNLMQAGGIIRELNLSVRFLDTLYFSGFCQNSKDFRAVTTVHANCCRSINAKVKDLKVVLRDWKRFKKISSYKRLANVTANLVWSGHFGCWNSWRVRTYK